MKNLLLTLLLISPASFADWGDVYYCQMTTNSTTTLEGKRTDYSLERFQFKLDKAKNAMFFAEGLLTDRVVKLTLEMHWPSSETWYAEDKYQRLFFKKGNLLYVQVGAASGINSISADCDKF